MARSTASPSSPEPVPARIPARKGPFLRSIGQRLQRFFRSRRISPDMFQFDEELVGALRALAQREGRTEQEIARELLSLAIAQRDAAEAQLLRWRALTPREQQVVALVCLNYTNDQIAARLVISPETVKTHIRNVLWKLSLSSKIDLREALSDWDFSAYAGAKK